MHRKSSVLFQLHRNRNIVTFYIHRRSKKITSNLHSWAHARFSKWDHFHWHQKLFFTIFPLLFLTSNLISFLFIAMRFSYVGYKLGWFFDVDSFLITFCLTISPPYSFDIMYECIWWRHKALCMKCIAQRIFMQFLYILWILWNSFFCAKITFMGEFEVETFEIFFKKIIDKIWKVLEKKSFQKSFNTKSQMH